MANDILKAERTSDETQLVIGLLQDIKQTSKSTFYWVRTATIIIIIIIIIVLFVGILSLALFPFVISFFVRLG